MYHMYPYMYRNFRSPQNGEHESIGQHTPFKRGDLEGYVAAKDFASKPYAACTRSNAMAAINCGTILRADMTPKEYINLLIRQGQVPDKHFTYKETDSGYEINELNSHKETTKKVIFNNQETNSKIPIICKYFTPDSGRQFKEIQYHSNGEIKTINDYEDILQDETIAIAELEKLENLRKVGPQTVEIAKSGNPFMQDIQLKPTTTSPPTLTESPLLNTPMQLKFSQTPPSLATIGI